MRVNAFLATSVTFINEIAALCEQVGADATEVERGLKIRSRESARRRTCRRAARSPAGRWRATSCSSPSSAARMASPRTCSSSVKTSNDAHRQWAQRRLRALLGDGTRPHGRGLGADLQARHRHAAPLERDRTVPVAGRRRRAGPGARPGGPAAASGSRCLRSNWPSIR